MRSITESELAFDLLVAADESEIERAADALRKEANGVAVPAGISAGQAPLGGPRATVTGPRGLGMGSNLSVRTSRTKPTTKISTRSMLKPGVVLRLPVGMSTRFGEYRPRGAASGAKRHSLRAAPTVSAILAPRAPIGFGDPVVVSRAVWCSISASSSAPIRMTMAEIQSHVMKPITAPSEP
jgi:hypothetical protein